NGIRRKFAHLTVLLVMTASAVLAQSPNTASIVVTVVDQNDAVVKGANVSVVNTATGATRETVSGRRHRDDLRSPAYGPIQSECCDDGFHRGSRGRAHSARGRNRLGESQATGERRTKRSYRLWHHPGRSRRPTDWACTQ